MSEFLLWLSGADREVLARCPSERTKFVGIGGTVLTTAVIATAACTLTVGAFVGAPWPVAILVGLGWGLAIMNLDRWLVSSTKRQGSAARTILMAVPRVLLAIVIGLVIAEPLVLQVFQSEVTLAASEVRNEKLQQAQKKLEKTTKLVQDRQAELEKLRAELTAIETRKEFQDSPQYKEGKAACESAPPGDPLRTCEAWALNSGAVQKAQDADRPERLKSKQDEVATARKSLTAERQRLAVQREALGTAGDGSPGLLDRMQGLERLTSQNQSLNASQWVLRLFILALDSLPVLVKTLMMLGKPSLYDMTLDELENERLSEIQARTAANKRAATIEAQVLVQEAEERHDLELAAARELAFDIVEAQKELARDYITAWKIEAARQMQREIQNGVAVDLTTPPAPSGSPGGLGSRGVGPNGPFGGGRTGTFGSSNGGGSNF